MKGLGPTDALLQMGDWMSIPTILKVDTASFDHNRSLKIR